MRRVALSLSFGVWICAFPASAQNSGTGQWEPFEVAMTGSAELANPYVDGLPDGGKPYVLVTFTGTSGDAKGMSYAVPGFWDGGRTWKARFAPPAPGEWSYAASSADAGFQGCQGQLPVRRLERPPKRPQTPPATASCGWPKSGPRAGRYFEYADGTPFLWIGDTWWPWLEARASPSRAPSR